MSLTKKETVFFSIVLLVCLLLMMVALFSGCSFIRSSQIATPQAVLLPEDRIFTVKAGTEIDSLVLDGKPVGKIMFPGDMKLVSPSLLVRQEQTLNNAILDKVKADKNHSQAVTIFGSIMAFLASIGAVWAGAWFKSKLSPPTK